MNSPYSLLFGLRRKPRAARPEPPGKESPAQAPAPRAWTPVEQLYFRDHYAPVGETLPEDIFIAGYPKSGNTWVNHILAGVLFGILPTKSHAPIVNEVIPDIHAAPVYRRYRTPMFFKTHLKPQPSYRNVVYLLRDGRDAMVSYWHFQHDVLGRPVEFIEMVRDGKELFPCKWHEHVDAWMENPHGARMITVRYEDLLANTIQEMEKVCAFCGIDVDRAYLEMIVEKASFAELKAMGRRFGDVWSNFFRKGVAGSWRTEMPPEVLKAFLDGAGPTLRRHGYAE
jgi:hypothetical protein